MSELNEYNKQVITEFRANEGKVGGQMENMPVILLTMTGAKSGRTITKPLVYTTDGERVVVIASFAGAPHHPGWYHNLVANPEVTLEIGTERFRARAEVTSGEERQRLFDAQAAQMPIFHDYQKKTSRQIPVVVFNRID
ncbi:MAG: nitroreductase family deazaflavin-dependent oxidoreductase [Desulfurellaceae bacterium]|nr:nitroreductase family deazaflavin-dependent oxidoreductase [Desulfurellaceae bacterium]